MLTAVVVHVVVFPLAVVVVVVVVVVVLVGISARLGSARLGWLARAPPLFFFKGTLLRRDQVRLSSAHFRS